MRHSIHSLLLNEIIKLPKGSLVFPNDFIELGSNMAVRTALSRLTKDKILFRLGKGVYLYPEYDKEFGMLYPSTEDVAEAIAAKDRVRLISTGAVAFYQLGLSTQVPMNAVYFTDGARRRINLGGRKITFLITAPKMLATKGKFTPQVIQVLKEVGKDNTDELLLKQIKKALQKEDPAILRHDAKLAPVWIATLLFDLQKEIEHDRMVKA